MDPEFWRERWQNNEISFHEGRTNALLARHWPSLSVSAGAQVLVPLCGKSMDMVWLAAQGHRVIGIELSEIAVRAFFAEIGLQPTQTEHDGFAVASAGGISIWCGDLFNLQSRHVADVAGVYDRAALVAMPPSMQPAYAAKLIEIVPTAAPMLLVTFDYDQRDMSGPPFATPPAQVQALYGSAYDIREVERVDSLAARPDLRARGLTRAESPAFILRRL